MTPAEQIAAKHNAGIGHNSSGSLKSYADRLESLENDKKALAEDVRELKKEAKDNGINPKALAAVVKQRMEDEETRERRVALAEVMDTYRIALGILD